MVFVEAFCSPATELGQQPSFQHVHTRQAAMAPGVVVQVSVSTSASSCVATLCSLMSPHCV